MISHRRSSRRGRVWAATLVATLVIALSAQAGAAAPLADTPRSVGTPTRLEGQLLNVSGNTWLVDQTTVQLDADTTLVEVNGKAQVGAWVVVWGDQLPEYLHADLVHVLRPAGAPTPTIQFTGMLRKIAPPYWVVDDFIVIVDWNTQMGGEPKIGSQLSITAQRVEWDLVATNIAVLAVDATTIPTEFEGELEQIAGSTWVIDGTPVRIPAGSSPAARTGDWVEVRAVAAKDGTLVAKDIRIVDRSLEAKLDAYVTQISGLGQATQTWTVLVFDDGVPQTKIVEISAETYVDEDRTTLRPDVEAVVDGSKLNAVTVKADIAWLEQPAPAQAAGVLAGPGNNGLWSVGGEQVWFESAALEAQASSEQLASAQSGGRSLVVKGVRLRNGVLIVKEVTTGYADSFATGATRVDAAPWSFPSAVVPDLAKASLPTLLFGPDGSGHVIYSADGAIYHTMQPAGATWGTPHRIATGTSPSAAIDSKGQLHVAYVNEFMGNYDIYHVRLNGGKWTLPVNLSSTSGRSADPSIATDGAGAVHVAWMDTTSGQWSIHTGTWRGSFWTSYPVANARGQSPSLAILPDGELFLAWQDRQPTSEDSWGNYDIYISEREGSFWNLPVNVSENATYSPGSNAIGVSVIATRDGLAHLAWVNDEQQVRYNPGRKQYWPQPTDVGGPRQLARGLSMRLSQDGMLNLAWDEGARIQVVSAPPTSQVWPEAQTLYMDGGGLSDVSLANAGVGLAVAWVHTDAMGVMGIYESRHGIISTTLKCWLPLIATP